MVSIESLESSFKFLVSYDFLSIHGGHQPFTVADDTILVFIGHIQESIDLALVKVIAVYHPVTFNEFLFGESATAISVKDIECIS